MTGFEAFKALRDGKKVRCIMWTAGCYVYAIKDAEEGDVVIKSKGTPLFQIDISTFGNMVLEQLLEDAEFDAWEIAE